MTEQDIETLKEAAETIIESGELMKSVIVDDNDPERVKDWIDDIELALFEIQEVFKQ